ncbi:MAG: hypothetical protein ACYDDO_14150 [Acidiferrobacterales bacterium]
MDELYVKQKIEAGLKAVAEGRTVPHEDVKRRLMNKKQRGGWPLSRGRPSPATAAYSVGYNSWRPGTNREETGKQLKLKGETDGEGFESDAHVTR